MRFTLLFTVPLASARCTAIAVDEVAANGSGFAGMNADCSNCDGRVAFIPARKTEKERLIYQLSGPAPRFVGYGRGTFYEPKGDEKAQDAIGSIPETTASTFAYYEATLPLMNEKGLGLGESSCNTYLMNYPIGQTPKDGKDYTEGLLDITTLMQIALERCATARCAVRTMGDAVDKHGFVPMKGEWSIKYDFARDMLPIFADAGEAVTLADTSGESWVFHVVGGFPGITKSVWVAQRVPKGHVGFIANNFIIREIPKSENEDFLFQPQIREVALKAGLWNGTEPLDFARVFGANVVSVGVMGEQPIPMYASLRQWALLNQVQPSKGWKIELDALDYPSFVVPEKNLSTRDVQRWLGTVYEGTEFDMTTGILSGPFGNPFPSEGGPAQKFGQIPRGISIARTVYSIVNECPREGLHVAWYAADTPLTSVFVPFFPQAPACAAYYRQGVNTKYTRDSAWWAFDFVANWAGFVNFRNASQENIYPLKEKLETQNRQQLLQLDTQDMDAAAKWAEKAQKRAVDAWLRLADDLIVKYNDGFYNDLRRGRDGVGQKIGFPLWWAKMVGFDNDVHPIFVSRDRGASKRFEQNPELAPPDFAATRNPVPAMWKNDHWVYWPESVTTSDGEGVGYFTAALFGAGCAIVGVLAGTFVRSSCRRDETSDYKRIV